MLIPVALTGCFVCSRMSFLLLASPQTLKADETEDISSRWPWASSCPRKSTSLARAALAWPWPWNACRPLTLKVPIPVRKLNPINLEKPWLRKSLALTSRTVTLLACIGSQGCPWKLKPSDLGRYAVYRVYGIRYTCCCSSTLTILGNLGPNLKLFRFYFLAKQNTSASPWKVKRRDGVENHKSRMSVLVNLKERTWR